MQGMRHEEKHIVRAPSLIMILCPNKGKNMCQNLKINTKPFKGEQKAAAQ